VPDTSLRFVACTGPVGFESSTKTRLTSPHTVACSVDGYWRL
jgi:hypothetical protein